MMKHLIVVFSIGILAVYFNSCKKKEAREKVTNAAFLIGTWELRNAQNSMIPAIEYAPGNGNLLIFTDSTYEKYTSGQLVNSGRYFIINDTSVEVETGLVFHPGQFESRISFENISPDHKTFLDVSNNELTLLSGYFPLDGGSKVLYERQANKR